MRKIVDNQEDTIAMSELLTHKPIFAKSRETGELVGMVVEEKEGWIVRTGGSAGACGYQKSLKECMDRASEWYTFHVTY